MKAGSDTQDSLRLDKWLVYARFCKTRALAATYISRKKVRVNSQTVTKSHYSLRPGDVLTLSFTREPCVIRVNQLAERRGPASEAQTLYELVP